MDKTTLYIEDDVVCTYYPSTRSVTIENTTTKEYITLNLSSWAKVYQWLRGVTRNEVI